MATIVLQAHVSPDEILEAVDRMSPTDMEQFVARVLALRARRRAPGLPPQEAELLLRINEGIPSEIRGRYEELLAKREAEMLTPDEHRELIELVEQVEALQAARAENLAILARLRGVSLGELMKSLGICGAHDG